MSPDAATLEHQLQLYKGLVEVSGLINEIIDSQELLPAVLDVARRVLHAEAASLFLVNAEGDLELASSRGGLVSALGPSKVIVPRGKGISGWVLSHGQPLLVPDAYQDDRFFPDFDRQTGYRTRSVLCVPLVRRARQIGVLQILNPIDRVTFDQTDLEVLVAYANLAATAIDKLRTIESQRQQERIAQEFAFARDIQSSFLPQKLPERADLSFAAAYRPALNVGGDFYDVIELGVEELYFVIGDVSGKGMPAALLMAQALSTFRLIITPGISPREVLCKWNAMLAGHTVRGMFITALLGRITVSSRRVELINAGHCPPFRIAGPGRVEELPLCGSPPLGILAELKPEGCDFLLRDGEWLLLYTDGLVESFNAEDAALERVGVARLLQPGFSEAQQLVDALLEGEALHRSGAEAHDDLTLLAFGFR